MKIRVSEKYFKYCHDSEHKRFCFLRGDLNLRLAFLRLLKSLSLMWWTLPGVANSGCDCYWAVFPLLNLCRMNIIKSSDFFTAIQLSTYSVLHHNDQPVNVVRNISRLICIWYQSNKTIFVTYKICTNYM